MDIELIEPEAETALTLPQRAAVALGTGKAEQELIALVEKSKSITLVNSPAGRTECHRAAMAAADARIAIAKTGKAARDDATKFSKAVIAEENRLIALIEPEENRLLGLRDAWDAEQARIKAEAEAKERARVLAITEKIAAIKAYASLAMQCRTSERVTDLIAKVAAIEITAEAFAEFEDEAIEAKRLTLERMEQNEIRLQDEEAERARVKAEQEAAAAKLAAERAELARQQAEAAAAEAQAKAQRDAEAADLQRQRAAFAAEQAAAIAAQQKKAAQLLALEAELESKAQAQRDAEAAAELTEQPAIEHEAVAAVARADDAGDVVDAEIPTEDLIPSLALPCDGDVIAVAARAVADAFGLTFVQAAQRLARVEWATN